MDSNNALTGNDGMLVVWIVGGLAALFVAFILYDSYRRRRKHSRPSGASHRKSAKTDSRRGLFGGVRQYSRALKEEMKTRKRRKEAMAERQRRHEASLNRVAQQPAPPRESAIIED